MDSWLKRAEDLFEVVDRRAKLVVSELADEQSDTPPADSATNGKGGQARRSKSKSKARKRASGNERPEKADSMQEERNIQPSAPDSRPDMSTSVDETNGFTVETSTAETDLQLQDIIDDSAKPDATLSDISSNEVRKHDGEEMEVATTTNDEAVNIYSNGELGGQNASLLCDQVPLSASTDQGSEPGPDSQSTDHGQNINMKDSDNSLKLNEETSQSAINETPTPMSNENPTPMASDERKVKDFEDTPEPDARTRKQEETKTNTSLNKVEEQLDEAQGLLKSTKSTGQSKEARLARVCAGLSSRLQEYKSENAQLEELLTAERELCKSYENRIKQLQQELSAAKKEVSRVESNMADALAAKNAEIEKLVNSLDALKKQAALSEGSMASLQANMETLMRNRELTETRMMQALREELTLAERRAEEERAAHSATKKAAMEREVELEHRAVEASTALVRAQRMADERAAKAGELEQKVALLEVECASLNQELQDMEARLRREQKKSPEDANQLIQAWQQEVERARQGQRDAESKLSSLEAEVQKMRVEMAAMKRDAEHYSRQEHMELEKRYRELTDLLYYKQTQLETMASEKAAAEFQLDKEMKRLQEAQAEAERSKISRRASLTWDEEADMKELEPLPLHQRHLVGASIQLRKAAKLLDSGAATATRILWRHPRARVGLLCYLVFVHLFLMYLLHRLQAQADDFAAQEVAKAMGLSQPNLP